MNWKIKTNWSLNKLILLFNSRRSSDGHGFDQFGSLFGQVILKNGDDAKVVIEMNLPGVRRSRNHLDENLCNEEQKTISFLASCKDGLVLTLSAQDIENEYK